MTVGASTLYPTQEVAERVTAYSSERSSPLPKFITDYHAWVIKNQPRFNYMISNFQGQCHVFLAHLVGAGRVLEIGVYVGYSSLVWSHAVGPQGHVTGLEFSEEYAQMARDVFKRNDVKNVEVIQGDALQT
jgi:predicted O-methyltransferase YrrM